MFEKDLIFRQIHQLVQVLAYALQLKQRGKIEEAREEIGSGLYETLRVRIVDLLEMSETELLALCSPEGRFNAEMTLALAELMEQEGSLAGELESGLSAEKPFHIALLLYQALRSSGETVPLDIHDRIEWLRDQTG